jgi:hypothetical protein
MPPTYRFHDDVRGIIKVRVFHIVEQELRDIALNSAEESIHRVM